MAPLRVIRVIRIDGPLGPRGSRVRQPPGPRVVVAAGAASFIIPSLAVLLPHGWERQVRGAWPPPAQAVSRKRIAVSCPTTEPFCIREYRFLTSDHLPSPEGMICPHNEGSAAGFAALFLISSWPLPGRMYSPHLWHPVFRRSCHGRNTSRSGS